MAAKRGKKHNFPWSLFKLVVFAILGSVLCFAVNTRSDIQVQETSGTPKTSVLRKEESKPWVTIARDEAEAMFLPTLERPFVFKSLHDPGKRKKQVEAKCTKPKFVNSLVRNRTDTGLGRFLSTSSKFAWCHDGNSKNGEFSLGSDGVTSGDFFRWQLIRWRRESEYVIVVDNGNGGNEHRLVFNCEGTGFYVSSGGQRGYVEGLGYTSPNHAGAPSAVAQAPDCTTYDSSSTDKVPVWVWWDFPNGVKTVFRMNLKTWRRHINPNKFDLFLLDSTNIRKFLPAVPEPFFRLYQAAKSDFLRAALISTHGGIYMDGDMLLSNDLDVAFKKLLDGTVNFMPYMGPGDRCPNSYTTNFMGGSKGNALSTKWIQDTIRAMYGRCSLPEANNSVEPVKVCCYDQDWCPRKECHVAWGEISHPPKLNSLMDAHFLLECIPSKLGFSQTMSGKELFFNLVANPTGQDKSCWLAENDGLHCSEGIGLLPHYMGRHGHHLYNMLQGDWLNQMEDSQVLKSGLVVAELYRRSLQM